MPTNPDSYKYYPTLSSLITVDELPDFLSFIKEHVQSVFDNIYYKDYYSSENATGSSAFYRLDIVPRTRLEQEVLGTGMILILNPDYEDSIISSFPITVFWQWKILQYVRNFNISTFSETSEAFFDLAINILGISQEQILIIAVNSFLTPGMVMSPFKQLVSDINTLYNCNIEIDINAEDRYEQLVGQIDILGKNIYLTIFTLYLLTDNSSETEQKLKDFFFPFFSTDFEAYIKDLFVPKISVSLNNLSLALEFPRTWLKPVDNTKEKSMLCFKVGTARFTTENGLEFEDENEISFDKSEIGNTGLTIFFDKMKLDLSRTSNIPEATAAGYPDDFIGVFVESAEIGLPSQWFESIASTDGTTLGIFGENLLLGTGGISGTFGLRAMVDQKPIEGDIPEGAEMRFTLGGEEGFVIGFTHFDFTLKQGEFVSTNIKGSLEIPGFKDAAGNKAKIEISMSFDKDGNFYITASEKDGIPLPIPGVLTYTMKSLTVGRKQKDSSEKFYLSTSGSIEFTGDGMVSELFEDPLEIDSLVIWQDGTIELKGLDGTIKLPKPKTLKLGPADITVTAIHFGTDERMHNNIMRKYWYFGFDGGISINPGGIDARGDGVKVYFTVDNNKDAGRPLHLFFRIQSLSVDLVIPGSASRDNAAVIINGYLSMKEPTDEKKGTEYIGGISLDLPKLRLSASAGMRMNPSVPAFLVDVSLNLPTAIPLGPTGVGIYGFRGLLGQKYVTSKEEVGLSDDSSWYEYYKAKVSPDYREGVQVSKFAQEDGFSVGAGVSLATAFDGGKVFSAKVFVMLSLPETLLIIGQGAILRERIGLDTTSDPPFSAMIAISDKSVEANFGINLNIPDGGEIAEVRALIEMAFFFGNSGGWYLNIGRDQPEDKRVSVKLFTLFKAYFYFMVSNRGIAAGAGVKWDFKKKLGPLKLKAGAYLDVWGKIGFKPVQIGGGIALGGYAEISVWRLGLGISLDAYLAAEAPKPFIITGGLKFKLKLPWPVKKLGGPYKLDFTWNFRKPRDTAQIPLIDPYNNVKAINRLTGESFPVYYKNGIAPNSKPEQINSFVIPVDSFIDVEFLKGMGPGNASTLSRFGTIGAGANYIELVPPEKGKSAQVKHEFKLENIEIRYWNENSGVWTNYNMYEAIRPKIEGGEIEFPSDTSKLAYGFWQCETPGKYNKLRILSRSPLSYITHFTSGPPSPPEDFGYKEGFLFCQGEYKTKTCVTFPQIGQKYLPGKFKERQRILIRVTGNSGGIVLPFNNSFNLQNALTFSGKVELFLPGSQALVDLKLTSYASEVIIKYYHWEETGEYGFGNLPLSEYVEIAEETFIPSVQGNSRQIAYRHTDHNGLEVNKITIESIGGTVDTESFLQNEYGGSLLQENMGGLLLENSVASSYNETRLFGICMMTLTDYNFNWYVKSQDQVNEDNSVMRESFTNVIEPIWRPDTAYRIEITTNDYLFSEKNPPNYQKSYCFFFKTAGPVGHFHTYDPGYQALLEQNMEDQFRLATLKPYIDYSRSYPNADGRLINSKPLFFSDPKLLVFYKQNTVYAMFNGFDAYESKGELISELQVLIKSPTEELSPDPENPTAAHIGKNNWIKNPDPIMTPEVRMINNLALGEMNCSGYEQMTPLAVAQEIETGGLEPDTLYTAVFNAVYKEDTTQVHSYVFKTSQYADFNQQVQSYLLKDETGEKRGEAIFNIEKEFDTTKINDAIALLNGTLDSLKSEYANEYDRLTDGILQLGVLSPAVTTDFNIIRNSLTGNIIGIIIRNPEPFNDPKIPAEDLNDTMELSADGTPASDYEVIFSADKTQAFISNRELNIPSGTAVITFRYKQFSIHNAVEVVDGEEVIKKEVGYDTLETEEVSFEV